MLPCSCLLPALFLLFLLSFYSLFTLFPLFFLLFLLSFYSLCTVCRYANGNVPELYTLSIRNVRYGYHRDSKPDIKALKPIFGRWMVNVLESAQPDGPVIDTSYNAVAVTKVTHNSGASWVRICCCALLFAVLLAPPCGTSYNAVAVTKVTHNSGASWVRLCLLLHAPSSTRATTRWPSPK